LFESRWRYEGGRCCDRGNFPRIRLSGYPGRNSRRPGLGWCQRSIGGRRNWLLHLGRAVVYGCCPGVQALTVRGHFVVAPVDMLAVEVANIQTGVWERRDGRRCESRAWTFVDVNDLISCDVYAQPLGLTGMETDRPVTIPTASGQTWQGRDSYSELTQLVKSWKSPACLQWFSCRTMMSVLLL